MRGRSMLITGLLWLGSTSLALAADRPPIPAHPRELRYDALEIRFPDAEVRRHELSAGAVVFLAEDHTLPLVEITVALRAGSFLEPAEQAGLASLTGALVRRGGTRFRSADSFDDRTETLGARIESSAGFTRSGASLSVPTWAFDEALDLFFEALDSPAFEVDRLASIEANLLESMSRRNQDPLEVLEREWNWLVNGRQHFIGLPVTPASLEAIDRETLIRFHQLYWRPQNMLIAVSGDFQPEAVLRSLEQRLEGWPSAASGGDTSRPIPWPPEGPKLTPTPGLYHYESDVSQAKVALGARLPREVAWISDDRFSLDVLGEILGGTGAISRLAGRLRTAEGLVYRAAARIDPGELWRGEFQLFFDTRSDQVPRAVDLSLEELERIRRQPVHPTELEVAKQTLRGRLRLSFDTAEEIAGLQAENELLGRPRDYWNRYLRGVETTTAEDLMRVAQTYLEPDQLVFLVVGRWHEIAHLDRNGGSSLERITGHEVHHLPARDPLTLRDLDSDSGR